MVGGGGDEGAEARDGVDGNEVVAFAPYRALLDAYFHELQLHRASPGVQNLVTPFCKCHFGAALCVGLVALVN